MDRTNPSERVSRAEDPRDAEHREPIDQLAPAFRERELGEEGMETPPMWLWATIFAVLLVGVFYLGRWVGDFSPHPWLQHPAELAAGPADATEAVDGAQVFQARCASCHQADGRGVPATFPPLDGSDWVTGPPGLLIRIVLGGLEGPVTVQGTTYSGSMPAWGPQLTDAEVAAVVTHVRTSFGNDAGEVTSSQVAAVRAATDTRSRPWTADALLENAGIPEGDGAAANEAQGRAL